MTFSLRTARLTTCPLAIRLASLLLAVLLAGTTVADDSDAPPPGTWHGYAQHHFRVAGQPAYVVVPKRAAPGNPWVWRARFPNYHADADVALLAQGFHIGYVDVAGMFGSPRAVEIGDAFHKAMVTERGLSAKPALEGVSRGGLFVYNWAARNPEKVACIYCDTPVCDFKSWPGGLGTGVGSPAAWKECLAAYGFRDAEQAERFNQNPLDHAKAIAAARIPILHIVSENDRVVPPSENTYLLQKRLEQHGHSLEVISVPEGTEKSQGHHFTHPDPNRVVRFIARHASPASRETGELLRDARRILFLGDSITYAGHYVAYFDAWLASQEQEHPPIVINAGLPSETVSGLSEEGHAGGKFPRPHLAERLERVLDKTKPDLVFACYGINCGIYQPFSEERFGCYQQGIEKLKEQVEAAGAELILVTPPHYDDQRAKKSFSYNAVLDRYADWLIGQRSQGWRVIDLHGPMGREVERRRKTQPDFTFQPDAVHPNEAGHWFIARQLIGWFGDERAAAAESPQAMLDDVNRPEPLLQAVRQRMQLRRDAYLTAAAHQRPGIRPGLPLDQMRERVEELNETIEAALTEDSSSNEAVQGKQPDRP